MAPLNQSFYFEACLWIFGCWGLQCLWECYGVRAWAWLCTLHTCSSLCSIPLPLLQCCLGKNWEIKKKKRKKRTFWGPAASLQALLAVEEDLWRLSGEKKVRSEVESRSPSIGGVYNARAAPWGTSVRLSFPLGLTRGRRPSPHLFPPSCYKWDAEKQPLALRQLFSL